MLRLLCELDEYCEKHNLRYFLTGGTLIGAVRHRGFIPWDDDADVVMPRKDYERLVRENYIAKDAQVVSIENPQGYYHPFAYCNIADTNTIMLEKNIKRATNKGVSIDVFPLDGVPDDIKLRRRHLKKLLRRQSIYANAVNVAPGFSSLKNAAKTILGMVTAPMDKLKLGKKVEMLAKKYRYDECRDVAHTVMLFKAPWRFITPREDYSDYVLLDFEGHKFRCPVEYDKILKRSFGDYMQLPPENEREGHHGIEVYERD